MRTSFVLLISIACLAGCGFKGPLYLPDRSAAAAKPASRPTPATPATTPAIMPDEQRPVPSDAAPAPK